MITIEDLLIEHKFDWRSGSLIICNEVHVSDDTNIICNLVLGTRDWNPGFVALDAKYLYLPIVYKEEDNDKITLLKINYRTPDKTDTRFFPLKIDGPLKRVNIDYSKTSGNPKSIFLKIRYYFLKLLNKKGVQNNECNVKTIRDNHN